MPLPTTNGEEARTFLRDRAYDALFDAIQSGQLHAGEVLRDEELMDWLGMSRTPIRHALIRLAGSGLIEMSAGRQTTVSELHHDRTNRALFVSGMYNAYAIRRVGGRLSAPRLERLTRHRGELHAAVEAGLGASAARAISAFFSTITDACGNAVLDEQVDHIDAELARFLQPGAGTSAVDIAVIVAGVDGVCAALHAHDTSAALRALAALYAVTHHNFLDKFREPEIG